MDEIAEKLETDLSNVFDAPVTVNVLNDAIHDGVQVVVCQLSYRQRSTDGDRVRHISQTAVVLQSEQLDLPQFALRPQATGVAAAVFGLLGGFGNIKFPESPEFSDAYLLHGWAEQPVRILFTEDARRYFAQHHGWSVRGHRDQLVVFRHNETIEPEDRPEFVRDATQILSLLQEGERLLDQQPEIRRHASGDDMLAATRSMGLAGSIIARQLQKHRITAAEMQAFLQSAPPRTIPPGMNQQLLGDTLVLVFVGCFFAIGGIVGLAIFLTVAPAEARLPGILGASSMMLIGIAVTYFTTRHRRRKLRTLRDGPLSRGVIKSVRSTSTTVNNQVQNVVTVEYESAAGTQVATCNVYGTAATTAQDKLDRGESVQVLVDPNDVTHMISPDLLAVFDG